jgi:hypothetical protein
MGSCGEGWRGCRWGMRSRSVLLLRDTGLRKRWELCSVFAERFVGV